MKRFSDILYEIQDHLSAYEEHELLDESSLRLEALNLLKLYGPLVTLPMNTSIVINNYRGELPFYFYRLDKATRCAVVNYEIKGNPPAVLSQTVMKIREEVPIDKIGDVNYYDPEGKYKRITETFLLNTPNTVKVDLIANNRLVRVPFIGSEICMDCADISPNLIRDGNKFAIVGNQIHTDFESGIIYLEYNGYPSDDDGELLINDGGNGSLDKYIFSGLMHKSYVKLWEKFNKDVKTRIDHYKVEKESYKATAMTALKSQGLVNGEYAKVIKKVNKRHISPYKRILKY